MRFEKKVQVVTVSSRNIVKSGQTYIFCDLHYLVNGEGVGTVGVSPEVATLCQQSVGKEVVLDCVLEQDRKTNWLYRMNVIGLLGFKASNVS